MGAIEKASGLYALWCDGLVDSNTTGSKRKRKEYESLPGPKTKKHVDTHVSRAQSSGISVGMEVTISSSPIIHDGPNFHSALTDNSSGVRPRDGKSAGFFFPGQ